jgi:hypothetical protein
VLCAERVTQLRHSDQAASRRTKRTAQDRSRWASGAKVWARTPWHVRCKPGHHLAWEPLSMRTAISKIRPLHVALFIASLLYLIAGTARSAPLGEDPTIELVDATVLLP